MSMDVGGRIKAWRKLRGLSRQDLADAVGVSVSAVYQWEGTGEQKTSPSVGNLEKIVEALDLTMGEFYGRVPRVKVAS